MNLPGYILKAFLKLVSFVWVAFICTAIYMALCFIFFFGLNESQKYSYSIGAVCFFKINHSTCITYLFRQPFMILTYACMNIVRQ